MTMQNRLCTALTVEHACCCFQSALVITAEASAIVVHCTSFTEPRNGSLSDKTNLWSVLPEAIAY
jgi:hypothetical protein